MDNRKYPVNVDLDSVKIGGGAYAQIAAVAGKSEQQSSQKKPDETDEFLQKIKDAIKDTHYYWLMLRENYDQIGLSEAAYFEIAKYAIDLYPCQMNRLRDDKLSPNHYYGVCQVMAKHGEFSSVKCDKLKQARGNGKDSALYEIMFTAMIEWCFKNDYYIIDTPRFIYNYLKDYRTSLRKPEYASLMFLLWLCEDIVPTEHIVNMVKNGEIRESNISYVTNIILKKISITSSTDFAKKIAFGEFKKSGDLLPLTIKNACDKIENALYDKIEVLKKQQLYQSSIRGH